MKRFVRMAAWAGLCIGAAAAGLRAGSPVLEPPPDRIDDLYKLFGHPPNTYRILFLLRTNDEVSQEEIAWQVRSIKEQGGGGVFAYCEHLQGGSPQKFLTDWWWKVVDWTAAACAAEGIEFWVYDEEDWPSGTAGGLLLRHHPELTWKYLRPAEHRLQGPTTVDLPVVDEPLVGAIAFQLDGKNLKADTVVDLTDRVADRRLRWEVPAGPWTVAIYTAATGKVWNLSDYPDLMGAKAGTAFVDLVYRAHDERVRRLGGPGIVGYFTDEPSFNIANYPAGKVFPWVPAVPFSPDLPAAFEKQHGYAWRRGLPMLYYDAAPKSLQFRCHHWQTCNRLYCENYFGRIFRFCEERGQVASGHVHVEESLMAHLTLQGGNILAIYRNMHVPGIDWIYPFQNPLPANVPKYATSMAHLMGRPRTWCESFAACGYGLTFQQICRLVNWEHVNGINMQIPICYKYSLRGPGRTTFYCPGISYQQPYWDHFRAFADYEARLCLLASGLGHVAQIALAYPAVDLWAHTWDHDLLNARGTVYTQIGDALRQAGYDYDVLDDEAIQQHARVADGHLATPTEQFKVLILPPADAVSRRTLARAVELARAGGIVLVLGGLPRHSIEAGSDDPELVPLLRGLLGPTGHEKAQAGQCAWNPVGQGRAGFAPAVEDLAPMLNEAIAPDLSFEPGTEGLTTWHRRLADADLYLVLNRRTKPLEATFTLQAQGRPEKWNPLTGLIEPVNDYEITPGGTRMSLPLASDELVSILLRPAPASERPAPRPERVLREMPIAGPFAFRIEQTMNRPHVAWNFTQDGDGWTRATTQPGFSPTSQPAPVPDRLPPGDWCEHGLENFSGLGHYETDLDVEAVPAGARALLSLGQVGVSAEVFLNGQSAGVVFAEPCRLDVTRFLKAGRNRLRITVANTLANYYGQFKECAHEHLNAGGVQPQHKVSGLLGPVTLRVVQ